MVGYERAPGPSVDTQIDSDAATAMKLTLPSQAKEEEAGFDGEAVMSNPAKNDSFYEFLRENELIQNEFIFPEKKTRIG